MPRPGANGQLVFVLAEEVVHAAVAGLFEKLDRALPDHLGRRGGAPRSVSGSAFWLALRIRS